ncbi:phage head closure protein [Ructibacterium gallinarum]|uniref:Phage head closure protein n=1 Tax=Ructibacterium gallinarum TaxID=2779355 RepID=A0A9D5R8V7_9FIRM|nr:phage head closure protein [Ructibacterium gallinarum]MBE5039819.1 phage head closure protein [Ructibacterium gallinarum]
MDFSKLRHRVIFLHPGDLRKNSMGETVPGYIPFKPSMPSSNDVYLTHDTDGSAVLKRRDGKAYSSLDALHDYSVAAFVSPMSGREYEESQKLRAETTYKIVTRFFPGITPQMRILYDSREFEIVSVLDMNEQHTELQIVAAEKGRKTAQNTEVGDGDG